MSWLNNDKTMIGHCTIRSRAKSIKTSLRKGRGRCTACIRPQGRGFLEYFPRYCFWVSGSLCYRARSMPVPIASPSTHVSRAWCGWIKTPTACATSPNRASRMCTSVSWVATARFWLPPAQTRVAPISLTCPKAATGYVWRARRGKSFARRAWVATLSEIRMSIRRPAFQNRSTLSADRRSAALTPVLLKSSMASSATGSGKISMLTAFRMSASRGLPTFASRSTTVRARRLRTSAVRRAAS